jgi:hypothetical protein
MSAITYFWHIWAPLEIEAEVELPTKSLIADKAAHQSLKNQIPLGCRTAEMLRFQPWF